jgi:energy-coupling factor transporter transmembrane protein EcfT
VLFARSYYRAEGIHRAMVSRGFAGRFSPSSAMRFGFMDAAFAIGVAALIILARTR